jgi:hypothetical protein
MKFNPVTKELFTDANELIKTLHCPRKMRWTELAVTRDSAHRHCHACAHVVLHTAEFTDEELLATVRADPSTCLYIQSGQANITLIARSPGGEST